MEDRVEKQDGEKSVLRLTGTAKGKDYHFYARAVRDEQGLPDYGHRHAEDWGSFGEKMRRPLTL